ncbi:MAG: hypothetical protein M1819_003902 [Sarea resinae]|nr:MAG: hypothetical protein M1819_003902 [Sarea resinae]
MPPTPKSINHSVQSAAKVPPASPNSVLLAAESQWLFEEEDLRRTPSALDGLSLDKEEENRGKGVNFITQVGVMLKLPQMTLAVASVFLHRFYMRHSMVDLPGRPGLHYYTIAATALFLASKVEENCRKMRELVIACCRIAQKNPSLIIDEQSKEYWRWRDTILHNEDILLEAICFDLSVEPPYKILFDLLTCFGEENNKRLRHAAWTFISDSNLTMLCVLFSSRTIAAAALYCAARHCNVTFKDRDGKPWWKVVGVALVDIRRASNRMASIYEKNPLRHAESIYARTPEDGDEMFARTRARISNTPPSPGSDPIQAADLPEQTAPVSSGGQTLGKHSRDESVLQAGNGTDGREYNGIDDRPSHHATNGGGGESAAKRQRLDANGGGHELANGRTSGSTQDNHYLTPGSKEDELSEEGEVEES